MKSYVQSCVRVSVIAAAAALFSGCGSDAEPQLGEPETEGDQEVLGSVSAALTAVPSGVLCIRITSGGTPKNFAVSAGIPTVNLDLGLQPSGLLIVSAAAYNLACPAGNAAPSASPTWVSDPSSVEIQAGRSANVQIVLVPAQVATATVNFQPAITDLATAYTESYGVGADGSLWYWGANGNGLAAGPASTPTRIASVTNVKQVAAGVYSACALLRDSTVRCWGQNNSGQLGDGTTLPRTTAVSPSGLTGVKAIAAGWSNYCAIVADDTLRCWGDNGVGQLGNGVAGDLLVPTATYGTTRVLAVDAGVQHTCVLTFSREVYCVGSNSLGQLGDGTTVSKLSWTWVPAAKGAKGVYAARDTTFVVRGDGLVLGWGENDYGQLGDGTRTNRSVPTAIAGFAGAESIAIGSAFSCGLMPSGGVKCTGVGGRLGQGSPTNTTTPVNVLDLEDVEQLVTGTFHSCARKRDGQVYCWGAGGALGDGILASAFTPVRVAF